MALRWKRVLGAGAAVVVIGVAAAWFLTKPDPLAAQTFDNLGEPDLARGEALFWAGGCTGCHAADGAADEDLRACAHEAVGRTRDAASVARARAVSMSAAVETATPIRRRRNDSGLPNSRRSVSGTRSASATPSNAMPVASTPP